MTSSEQSRDTSFAEPGCAEAPALSDSLSGSQVTALADWLLLHLGFDQNARSSLDVANKAEMRGGGIRLEGGADVDTLNQLAGPAVLDALFDRVDLPAQAVRVGPSCGRLKGTTPRGIEPDTYDMEYELGDDDDGQSKRLNRDIHGQDGFVDATALLKRIADETVGLVQVHEAWRWMPKLRALMRGVCDVRLHATLELVLLAPGGQVMATFGNRLDHQLVIQVFGRTTIKVTDANPEAICAEQSSSWMLRDFGGKKPLRRATIPMEPGAVALIRGQQALSFELGTAGGATGSKTGWSAALLVSMREPRMSDLAKHLGARLASGPSKANRICPDIGTPLFGLADLLPANLTVEARMDEYWASSQGRYDVSREGKFQGILSA